MCSRKACNRIVTREGLVADSDTGQDSGRPERISEAEHAVMEALWEQSPLTAADVADKVGESRGWSLA
ncbi:MAG TPA: BlaI/MecI/CopY family transcriptional regulator, partial [Devosia sp.]|nr:BlaI/MecI/CopY family transcriptional regulator [Devosia sp.]